MNLVFMKSPLLYNFELYELKLEKCELMTGKHDKESEI